MTALLSVLRGHETTMKPANCRSHSRVSRLISRTLKKYQKSKRSGSVFWEKKNIFNCFENQYKFDQPAGDWGVLFLCNPRRALWLLRETFPCGLRHNFSETSQTAIATRWKHINAGIIHEGKLCFKWKLVVPFFWASLALPWQLRYSRVQWSLVFHKRPGPTSFSGHWQSGNADGSWAPAFWCLARKPFHLMKEARQSERHRQSKAEY